MAEEKRYTTYKWGIFVSMYVGYTVMFLARKSFSFALPAVISEQGLDKDDLGLIMSSQLLAYSISKFLGGMLVDVVSPRILFCGALALSGLTVLIFPMFESKIAYAILWFILGFVQGGGWPSCGKILRKWFSPSEFGTGWSVLSTSMNVASSAGPMLITFLIAWTSWRQSMQIVGTMAVALTGVCLMTIVDSPDLLGLTTPHDIDKKEDKGQRKLVSRSGSRKGSLTEQLKDRLLGKPRGRGRGTWQDLIRSPLMWLLGISYLVVFMARSAVQDWGQLYLIQSCSQTVYVASMFTSTLDMGGIVGSIVAGVMGDRALIMGKRESTRGSPRLYIVMAFVGVAAVALHLIIFTISETSSQLWICVTSFLFGFGIYGPIAVYGVMAIESAPSHLSGTSHAIVGLFANVGGVSAGLPFSVLAEAYDWSGGFLLLELLLVLILGIKILARDIEYKMVPIKKKMQ